MRARGRLATTLRAAGVAWRVGMLALVVALALACERRRVAPPTAPPGGGPPPVRVEAVFPPARSAGVSYDTPVWVQFLVALDTTTVNERTVFLKADTRRLSTTLTWEPATRRLRIVPHERLALRQTYTVELAAALRFMDGSTLGQIYAWQFTTNSLRRVQSPLPMDGRVGESPFVALRWGGLTESTVGPVTYEIHAAADSALAADPGQPPVGAVGAGLFVPRTRWRQDGPNFWAIHALNGATGERLVGPVWRFDTFPVAAPYDSVPAVVVDWDWVEQANQGRQHCTEDSLTLGPVITSTIRWNLGPPDTTVRLAGVAIELTPRYATIPAAVGPSVWFTTGPFAGCALGFPAPPSTDAINGKLADAVVLRPDRIRFSSDALAAHVEATRRLGGLFGYLFRNGLRRTFYGPGAGSPTVRAVMWLYMYRPGPAPAAAPAWAPLAVRPPGR